MQSLLLGVDRLSTWLGQLFAWLIVLLTLMISWEVFSRYVLNNPHDWALDAQIMMYGTLFMMAGAYTLAKNGHVRGDVLYGFFMPRTQATLDLILYFIFFMPGIVALKVLSRITRASLAKFHPAQVMATTPGRKNTKYRIRSSVACVRGLKKPYRTSPRTCPFLASV